MNVEIGAQQQVLIGRRGDLAAEIQQLQPRGDRLSDLFDVPPPKPIRRYCRLSIMGSIGHQFETALKGAAGEAFEFPVKADTQRTSVVEIIEVIAVNLQGSGHEITGLAMQDTLERQAGSTDIIFMFAALGISLQLAAEDRSEERRVGKAWTR